MPLPFHIREVLLATVCCLLSSTAMARKTNQALVEDPFDTAAGGSNLTRATRQGVMFANPALMPYGGKFVRWIGTQFGLIANKDSVDLLQSLAQGNGTSEEGGDSEMIDRVFATPVHLGMQNITSFVTNNAGIAAFGRFEVDLEVLNPGRFGPPEVHVEANAYAGGAGSFAIRTFPWLSLGVTYKYLLVAEPDLSVGIADQEQITSLSDPTTLAETASYGTGMGADAGALLFLQGYYVDYRLALKVDDVGDTSFTGTQESFKQIMSVGTSLTFHTNADAIHLSVDYRDIQGVYGESIPERIYAGTRVTLREYVGLAAGLYQGYPTLGARLDLILCKIGVTSYIREMGNFIENNPRNLYVVYLSSGF